MSEDLLEGIELSAEDLRRLEVYMLFVLVQAYYHFLQKVVGPDTQMFMTDLRLNECYLYITESLQRLLSDGVFLKDFPVPFEPLFDDVFSTTLEDYEWDLMVAPGAEALLAETQRYVLASRVGLPLEGSPAGVAFAAWRARIESAMQYATQHHDRLQRYCRKILERADAAAAHPPQQAQRRRRAKRSPEDVANDEVAILAFIVNAPTATRKQISEATGIAPAHVSTTKTWAAHKARKREAANAARVRARGGTGDPTEGIESED